VTTWGDDVGRFANEIGEVTGLALLSAITALARTSAHPDEGPT